MTTEHRRHPRYPVELAAEITAGGRTLVAATQNLSEGGVGLVVVEDGRQVAITLFLTQDGIEDPEEEPLEAKATVAWSAPREDGMHVTGVRFAAISEPQRAQLTRFLKALA